MCLRFAENQIGTRMRHVVAQLPTDVRHNSKIDRTRLSRWADSVLAGGPLVAP